VKRRNSLFDFEYSNVKRSLGQIKKPDRKRQRFALPFSIWFLYPKQNFIAI